MSSSVDLASYTVPAVLTDGHILTTTVTAPDGTELTSAFDLDTVVGNENGTLSWGGTNFSQGAQNITITNGCELGADLIDSNGQVSHSLLYIGSIVTTDSNGNPAIQHAIGVTYSTAHAVANTNDEADKAVHGQAGTSSGSGNSITSVTTIHGNAADYWPQGNAPASGSVASVVQHAVSFGFYVLESAIHGNRH